MINFYFIIVFIVTISLNITLILKNKDVFILNWIVTKNKNFQILFLIFFSYFQQNKKIEIFELLKFPHRLVWFDKLFVIPKSK